VLQSEQSARPVKPRSSQCLALSRSLRDRARARPDSKIRDRNAIDRTMFVEKFLLISYFCFEGICSGVVVRGSRTKTVLRRRLVRTKGSEYHTTRKGLGLNWAILGTKVTIPEINNHLSLAQGYFSCFFSYILFYYITSKIRSHCLFSETSIKIKIYKDRLNTKNSRMLILFVHSMVFKSKPTEASLCPMNITELIVSLYDEICEC
jgi:hypothetical protein